MIKYYPDGTLFGDHDKDAAILIDRDGTWNGWSEDVEVLSLVEERQQFVDAIFEMALENYRLCDLVFRHVNRIIELQDQFIAYRLSDA